MANVATVERPVTAVQTKSKTLVTRFGSHLTLDGYGANPKKLNDMHRVFTALNDSPDLLDMKKIITPYVVHYPGNGKKDRGGYSGMVMIAESHISIHTFPEQGFVSIDVYTCQGRLDVNTARRYFQTMFDVKEWEEHIIKRGTRYPLS